MVKITTPFVLAGVGLALIVIFLSISKFGIPTINKLGDSLGSAFTGFSGGISDFFDSLDPSSGVTALATDEEIESDPFFQVVQASSGTPQDAIADLDPDSPTFEQDKLDVLGDFGITGADSVTILESGGIEIKSNVGSNDRDKSLDNDPLDIFAFLTDFFGNTIPKSLNDLLTGNFVPDASAEEQQNRNQNPNQQQTTQPRATQQTGSVRSELVKSEQQEIQKFEVFGTNVDNRAIRGVIRQTPKNPRKLKTTSRNQPIETASERASRTFEDLGEFAGESRNEIVTKASKRNKFNFGTNTGSGRKISTVNRGGETRTKKSESAEKQRKKEALEAAAERARAIFDSGSINNF